MTDDQVKRVERLLNNRPVRKFNYKRIPLHLIATKVIKPCNQKNELF